MRGAGAGDDDRVVPSKIPSTSPHHRPWALTAAERAVFRERARVARAAKAAALRGDGPPPLHPINQPRLSIEALIPERRGVGLRALSLFSGGGGLDLGFARAGFDHVASYELLEDAAATLQKANPGWQVFGGEAGDVTKVDWRQWRDQVDVLHGGPPCQPFSNAGRQLGAADARDMWPAFVTAIKQIKPLAFIAENVPALASKKFRPYVEQTILSPLAREYDIRMLTLSASDFGVPQVRRRVVFVGFKSPRAASRYVAPVPTHRYDDTLAAPERRCMGAREALGLPDLGYDDLAPTIRSSLTGPRHTTSIVNSVSALHRFQRLEIWPHGVARTREEAHRFVAPNGHFRLAVAEVALLQGFPDWWPFVGATYMVLGQIGNAVPPPLAYAVASSVSAALAA